MKKKTAKKRKYTKRAQVTPAVALVPPMEMIDRLEKTLDAALDQCNGSSDVAMVAVIFDRKNMNKVGYAGAIRIGSACNTQEFALAAQYIAANAQKLVIEACVPRPAVSSLTSHLRGLASQAN